MIKKIWRAGRSFLNLDGQKLSFTNIDEMQKSYPGQRIYCHFMFKGERL